MSRIIEFVKDWMLPLAIVIGITICLTLHLITPLADSAEPAFSRFAKEVQPIMVAIMLFLQFNKVSPKDLRVRKWHLLVLGFQMAAFVALSAAAIAMPRGEARILVECAMLCFVCPTAAAAGVITDKLGGNLSDTVTYVVLINIMAALVIPLIILYLREGIPAPCLPSSAGLAGALHDEKAASETGRNRGLGILCLGIHPLPFYLFSNQGVDYQRNIFLGGHHDLHSLTPLHFDPVHSGQKDRKESLP